MNKDKDTTTIFTKNVSLVDKYGNLLLVNAGDPKRSIKCRLPTIFEGSMIMDDNVIENFDKLNNLIISSEYNVYYVDITPQFPFEKTLELELDFFQKNIYQITGLTIVNTQEERDDSIKKIEVISNGYNPNYNRLEPILV